MNNVLEDSLFVSQNKKFDEIQSIVRQFSAEYVGNCSIIFLNLGRQALLADRSQGGVLSQIQLCALAQLHGPFGNALFQCFITRHGGAGRTAASGEHCQCHDADQKNSRKTFHLFHVRFLQIKNLQTLSAPQKPGLPMLILQLPACRVNVQTPYIFQLFLSRYVSSLDIKNPGERGALRGKV